MGHAGRVRGEGSDTRIHFQGPGRTIGISNRPPKLPDESGLRPAGLFPATASRFQTLPGNPSSQMHKNPKRLQAHPSLTGADEASPAKQPASERLLEPQIGSCGHGCIFVSQAQMDSFLGSETRQRDGPGMCAPHTTVPEHRMSCRSRYGKACDQTPSLDAARNELGCNGSELPGAVRQALAYRNLLVP